MFIIHHCCNYIKKYFYFLSLETRYLYMRVIIFFLKFILLMFFALLSYL